MKRGLFALGLAVQVLTAQPTYDGLIRNARIVDGAGGPWFLGDVAIVADRIAAVGKLGKVPARWTVDAKGLTLAPGFIDAHSHGTAGLDRLPATENLVRQGVTTIVGGPDGGSPLPVGAYLDKLDGQRKGVNVALLVGHNTIRAKVMGSANRHATPAELESMKALVRQAMADGAFGMSTGLFYVPGNYAPTEELIELGKVVGALGGVHTSHIRSEAGEVVAGVRETIRIGEAGGLPTQVTHHKIIGQNNWGRSAETLRLIHEARARGVDVTIDAYPYTASSTGLGASLVPQWARAGGSSALRERAASAETGKKLRAEMRATMNATRGGPSKLVLASCGFDRTLAGKTLSEAAGARDPVEVALELVLRGDCSVVSHSISEEDVERILLDPLTMISSDGGVVAPGGDVPHPRNYGAFARVLARYVRERHTLTLEEALRRMTGLPAQRFSLWDRGLIRPGMKADLVLFDPDKIQDQSTFDKPHQYATGVHAVWVNGVAELEDGKMTGRLAGRPLRGPRYEARQDALLIEPDRVGVVTADTSHEMLVKMLGPERVKAKEVYAGEGEYEPGTVIDGDDPERVLVIRYFDRERKQPWFVSVCHALPSGNRNPRPCKWRTASGITIGTGLAQVELVNGRPFLVAGYGWDGEGSAMNWQGGRLAAWGTQTALSMAFHPGLQWMESPEFRQLTGGRDFSSSHPAMLKLAPKVFSLSVRFARP